MNRRPALFPCMILCYCPQEKSFLAGPPIENGPNIMEITNEDALFLTFCRGDLSLAEIAAIIQKDGGETKAMAEKFSTEPQRALQLLDDVERPAKSDPRIEIAKQVLYERDSTSKFIDNSDQLHQYHVDKISDAIEQFESRETTISHLYSQTHPALGGIPYGARMANKLCEMGVINKGQSILEIGGGTGYLARDFLQYLKQNQPQVFKHISYVMLELSPVLLESQIDSTRLYSSMISHVLGDAIAMPFSLGSFSIIIANEMIADLPSICIKKVWTDDKGIHEVPEEAVSALRFIADFDIPLDDAFPEFLVNLGAWQLLEHIYHLLAKGGIAIIIEYGSPWRYPIAVSLKDHTEYAIHFGHLEKIAKGVGFEARLEGLADFLSIDLDVPILERVSLTTLNQSLLPHLDINPLPMLAFTPETLEESLGDLYHRLYNLQFRSPKQGGCLGDPSEFYVFTLSKREAYPSRIEERAN